MIPKIYKPSRYVMFEDAIRASMKEASRDMDPFAKIVVRAIRSGQLKDSDYIVLHTGWDALPPNPEEMDQVVRDLEEEFGGRIRVRYTHSGFIDYITLTKTGILKEAMENPDYRMPILESLEKILRDKMRYGSDSLELNTKKEWLDDSIDLISSFFKPDNGYHVSIVPMSEYAGTVSYEMGERRIRISWRIDKLI